VPTAVTVVVGHGLWIAVGLHLVLGGWTGGGLLTAATLALTVAAAWTITRRIPPPASTPAGRRSIVNRRRPR
jgi:hypothetical protein